MVIKLERLSDGKVYMFKNIVRISDSKNQNLNPMPMAGNDYNNAQILALSGIVREFSIDTTITNSDTDVSDGTNETEVKTIIEQHIYLMNLFSTSNKFKFYHDDLFPDGQECAIRNIQISDMSEDPLKKSLSIDIVFGQVSTFE